MSNLKTIGCGRCGRDMRVGVEAVSGVCSGCVQARAWKSPEIDRTKGTGRRCECGVALGPRELVCQTCQANRRHEAYRERMALKRARMAQDANGAFRPVVANAGLFGA